MESIVNGFIEWQMGIAFSMENNRIFVIQLVYVYCAYVQWQFQQNKTLAR